MKGRITGINGFEEACALPGIEVGSFVNLGDNVAKAVSDGDRLGFVLATADTIDEAISYADQAADLIKFQVEQ